MAKWWMIRAGDSNELIPMWKENGIASIGWPNWVIQRTLTLKKRWQE
jgi:restriction system protein